MNRYKSENPESLLASRMSTILMISKKRYATVDGKGTHGGETVKSSGFVRAGSSPLRTEKGPRKPNSGAVKMLKWARLMPSLDATLATQKGAKS